MKEKKIDSRSFHITATKDNMPVDTQSLFLRKWDEKKTHTKDNIKQEELRHWMRQLEWDLYYDAGKLFVLP